MRNILSIVLCFTSLQALAFSSSEVVPAEQTKRNFYLSDSTISGGDPFVSSMKISALRWAKNPAGYERIVVDLSGEGQGWETKSPPYFQVGHDSRSNSISISVRGISARDISTSSLQASIAKSTLLSDAYIAPLLEGDLAAIQLRTRSPVRVESFYLVSPPRIVIDVRAKN